MADENVDTPPLEPGQEQEAETTPPILTHDVVPTATPSPQKKAVEVTRIPPPIVVGKLVVFPRAYGVDYTVDGVVKTQAQELKGSMKVKAEAKQGYKFAKGLKQTFNLES